MAGKPGTHSKRATGSIEKLPSGALRVRVYAGVDPLSKRCHELIEIDRPGPQVEKEAEAVRVRFVHQINERRPHRCKPLAATTIRHIHFILSGAFKKAIR
ncbi:hypothetical protein [Pseudonocardia oroxyli]|uniref:Uncharacterized protein n=1 Tax=Pseudonocardia oroxyli TaxID=366584 RepID=A0A1G8CFQ5_PSEOR|nr:hypothetical protein [Pseudonocardia oroxyli]SDH44043.1 hypothetical protein SAMN05216377_12279 [Pseudonocardia oroxyli]